MIVTKTYWFNVYIIGGMLGSAGHGIAYGNCIPLATFHITGAVAEYRVG